MGRKPGIQVIARAAAVLRALEQQPDGLSLGELAAQLRLPRSTVQRIVSALVAEHWLASVGPRAGFRLGPALLRLAALGHEDTERLARPILEALSRELGETVDLAVLEGRAALFVDQVPGSARLIAVSAVGAAFPLHCTANGKALLACVTAEQRGELLGRRLRRFTANTLTDPAKIERQLKTFAGTQLAYDLEEHTDGICAVGTGFVDPKGRYYAISVPVPVARFKARRAAIGEQLLAARQEVVRRIPGSRVPG